MTTPREKAMTRSPLTPLVRLLVVLALLLPPVTPRAADLDNVASAPPLLFGVVPQQSARLLARAWGPLLQHLERETGVPLRFQTATDIPTFEQRLAEGNYDLAYMNPYHYTVFHQRPGYIAFAREQGKQLKGIVVTSSNSPLGTIQELQGRTIAFPSPAAFAATILPMAEFRRQGFDVTPHYVTSHDSVYRAVAKGLFPAGGGVERTFQLMPEEVRNQLRVLWRTKAYSPHALAAHPRVAPETVERLQRAMTALGQTETGRELLKGIEFKGIEAADDAQWDDVRRLEIHLLDHHLTPP